jgi:Leucine-rich repeat (LRR) protein
MYIDLDEIDRFFKRVNMTKVPHFRFTRTELDGAKSKWFSGLTNANRLVLCNNEIEAAKFLKRLNLSNLLDLDLSTNNISRNPTFRA